MPTDCVVNEGLPQDLLEKALDEDGITGADRDTFMEPRRCFLEFLVFYHPLSPAVPADGEYVSMSVMLTLPASRGSVTYADDHGAVPVIQSGYFATGVRRVLQLTLATKDLEPYIDAEDPPPRLSLLHLGSSDADIEADSCLWHCTFPYRWYMCSGVGA